MHDDARAVARALGLPSYKEVKERTKTFFLKQLPALSTTATGEPNTDSGDFATEPIFLLTAMFLNTTIDVESLTKPGNYIARYEPITCPAAIVINLLMRKDRACSMYEEESNCYFCELSL